MHFCLLTYLYSIYVASPALSQSVFETASEVFSTSDLASFQATFGLPQQQPDAINGNAVANCAGMACQEGNLDVQYMMGIAQGATTIYWYEGQNSDPFLAFLVDIMTNQAVSKVNSISWSATESVR